MKHLKLFLALLALIGVNLTAIAQSDVTSTYITNADFEGTYTDLYTINSDGRFVYQPNGWSVDYKNVSTWNMTVVGSTDAMASNFTGTYAVPEDNHKYMVRFRDNQTSEYIDLSQTITVTEGGTYTFSADLIREDGSKINVELYAGDKSVTNSNPGTWETCSFSVVLEENTQIKVGIKFTNKGGGGVKAGVDNVKIMYTPFIRPTAISLNQETISLIPTETSTLLVTYTPDNVDKDKEITWTTSDPNVATVTNGVVTAVAFGSATITATTANGISATCAVTVNEAPLANGDYYIMNVSKGTYLGGANSWGSQASLIVHGIPFYAELANGVYKLNSRTYNSDTDHFVGLNDNGDLYMDNAGTGLYITPLGDGKYSISTADGSAYLTANNENTIVSNGATNTDNGLAQWMFVTKDELKNALANATLTNSVDATFYISDQNFSRNYWPAGRNKSSWTMIADNKNLKGGNNENMCAESYHSTFTLSQILTVPNGQYKLRAQACENTASPLAVVYANDVTVPFKSMANGEESMTACSNSFSAGNYYTDWITVNVTDNTLTVGVKSTSASNWCVWDNFELYYYGPNIAEEAVPLADPMEANKWYYFDLAVDGTYNLTASTLNDIVCTTDGSILMENQSNVTTQFAGAENQELQAGRYYVKSSSAQTFAFAPASYDYSLGEPVYSAADGGLQTSTFTVTFPEAATNEPEGVAALVESSTATVNGNIVNLTAVENGFSLEVGEITAGAEYSIVIPAEVYGFVGHLMNEALTLTIHAPTVLDGTYFVRTADDYKYISRGSSYNTRAIVDEFGLPMTIATNTLGITQFTFVDNEKKLFINGSGQGYTDNISSADWRLQAASNGGFYIVHANEGNYQNKQMGLSETIHLQAMDEGVVWLAEPVSEHNTRMEALKDAQAAAAATALGNEEITTKANLASWLEQNYDAIPVEVAAVSFTEKWNGDASAEWGAGKDMYTATVNDLPIGLYKLTVNAYYRMNGIATAAEGARANTYLYGNDVKTQLYSLKDFPAATAWEGRNQSDAAGYYPDDFTSGAAATKGENFLTELYVYVSDGTLTYGIHQPSRFSNGQWFGFQNFTLTRYEVPTITIREGFKGTTYSSTHPLDFSVAEGLTAYIITDVENGKCTIQPVTTVPAGTGVYVEGAAGKYTVNVIGQNSEFSSVDGNLLIGTGATSATVMSDDDYTYYMYGKQSGKENFFKVGTDKERTASAHKAYLRIPTSNQNAAMSMLIIGDDTVTGIDAVEKNVVDGEVYNLNGQRVNKAQKGIYIVNGKKIVLK